MNVPLFQRVCVLALAIVACSRVEPTGSAVTDAQASAPDSNVAIPDSGESRDAADELHESCLSASWQPIDLVNRCLGPAVVTQALCVNTPATHKGLYALCAFSPTHEPFFREVTQPVRVDAPGWTFAPAWLANLLGVPAATAAADHDCDVIQGADARPPLPSCP